MLTYILNNKKIERNNIHSDRSHFRAIFSCKKAKILGEIKPKKPWSDTCTDPKIIAKKLLKNPDITGFSILIDETFFGGNIGNIELIRHIWKPTLFKEFVFETSQIDGASYYGYDAVLLIVKMFLWDKKRWEELSRPIRSETENWAESSPWWKGVPEGGGWWKMGELTQLVRHCLTLNIEPLVEVDNASDLDEVLRTFSPNDITIGINCRDLDTLEIDRQRHFDYWRPEMLSYHTIALSGITDISQVSEYKEKYDGIVIGSLFTN